MQKLAAIFLLAFLSIATLHSAFAQSLQVLWVDPIKGPICAGPLGPESCPAVAQWIATHGGQLSAPSSPNSSPSIPGVPNVSTAMSTSSAAGAVECARATGQNQNVDVDKFLTCTRGALVLNEDSATLVSCAEQSNGRTQDFAACAGGGILGSKITPAQLKVINCAAQTPSSVEYFAKCLGSPQATGLSIEQRAVLDCAVNNAANRGGLIACEAQALFDGRASPEAAAAIDCALQANGDYQQFANCATDKFLHVGLNSEQQIALQCVGQSVGQPYVAAGCVASQLTAQELRKCVERGIGGDNGCFGSNNDLIGRRGFVVRNIAALAGGPNSVIRDPAQVLGGPNSVFNNPRQVFGGPNSVANQVIPNVPSPPPIEVGKVGNHRVCIPWC